MEKPRSERAASTKSAILFEGPSDPVASKAVRRTLGSIGAEWGLSDDFLADTALVVTELVSNAVRAGASSITVMMFAMGAGVPMVEIEVTDDAPGIPRPRQPGADETSGRGLQVVAGVAVDWGYVPHDSDGKTVWARIPPVPA